MFASVYDVFQKDSEMSGGSARDKDNARHMMRKMVNSMSAKMEIGSPMASMYLLGNPDHYASHNYVPFAWRQYVQFVRSFWVESLQEEEEEDEDWPGKDTEERIPIGYVDGKFVPASAVDDYRYRPVEHSNLTLFEWVQCSTKKKRSPQQRAKFEEETDDEDDFILEKDSRNKKANRPVQHPFMPDHPLFFSHSVSCNFGNLYTVIPNFIGGAVARSDKGDRAAYCMTI
ncbi:hypothetical protein B0H19DRAFT_886907, partial [Mycena capillaripes]